MGMGRELYATSPVYRDALDCCDEILREYLDHSVVSVMHEGVSSGDLSLLDETEYTQATLFALEYSLSELWRSWGVVPGVVLGHSVGEYVAACVAGVFSLADGLKLIAHRGRLMQALPRDGAMVAVFGGEQEVSRALAGREVERLFHQEATEGFGITAFGNVPSSLSSGSLAASQELASDEAKQWDAVLGKSVRAHFAAAGKDDKRLVGFAYAIDGKPVSVRTFAHKRIFEGQFGAFVRAMCVEADVARREAKQKGGEPVTKTAKAADLIAMVRKIDKAEETIAKTSGGNDNGYKKTVLGYNSNCYFKLDVNGDGKLVKVALTRDWSAR